MVKAMRLGYGRNIRYHCLTKQVYTICWYKTTLSKRLNEKADITCKGKACSARLHNDRNLKSVQVFWMH